MIEEADAWFEYLEATRDQSETRYREIEPWAWARLTQRAAGDQAHGAHAAPGRSLSPTRADSGGARGRCYAGGAGRMTTLFHIHRSARFAPAGREALSARAQEGDFVCLLVPTQEEAAGGAVGARHRQPLRSRSTGPA